MEARIPEWMTKRKTILFLIDAPKRYIFMQLKVYIVFVCIVENPHKTTEGRNVLLTRKTRTFTKRKKNESKNMRSIIHRPKYFKRSQTEK